MANEYFGGAPTAVQGGYQFGAADRLRRQRENALNALIERFGPEAADPAALMQLEGAQRQREMHPYTMGSLERTDAAQQAVVDQYGTVAGDPAAQGLANQQDQQNRELQQRAALNAAVFLQRAKSQGMDLGQAFDRVGQILPSLGIPAEQLMDLREQYIQDPDSIVAMLRSGDPNSVVRATGNPTPVYDESGNLRLMQQMSDGTTRIVEGVTPAAAAHAEGRLQQGAERLGLGWSNLEWDKVKEHMPARQQGVQLFPTQDGRVVADIVPGSPAEQEFEATLRELDQGDRRLVQSFGVVADHANVVQTNAQRALDFFSGADAGILLQSLRSGARRVPGTRSYEAWDALETMKNNIAVDELQRMRQSSPTGGAMGNVSDRDIALLTGALGRLEVERDPERLVEDIQNIVSTYQRIVGYAQQDAESAEYRAQLRRQRSGASFGPQPRPTPTPAAGAEPSIDDLLNQYAPRQ
ncbi:MAG: hypothetical protein M0R28_21110 [Pigmentiphaga sp.]|nr:hypothetical protein [Pigmentiphaga sp.]